MRHVGPKLRRACLLPSNYSTLMTTNNRCPLTRLRLFVLHLVQDQAYCSARSLMGLVVVVRPGRTPQGP